MGQWRRRERASACAAVDGTLCQRALSLLRGASAGGVMVSSSQRTRCRRRLRPSALTGEGALVENRSAGCHVTPPGACQEGDRRRS